MKQIFLFLLSIHTILVFSQKSTKEPPYSDNSFPNTSNYAIQLSKPDIESLKNENIIKDEDFGYGIAVNYTLGKLR